MKLLTAKHYLDTREDLAARLEWGGVGVELGVRSGNFAAVLLRRARPRLLYLVDVWKHLRTGTKYDIDLANAPDAKQATLYRGVCKRFRSDIHKGRVIVFRDFVMSFLATLPEHSLDWAYLDADHSKDEVRRNLEALYSRVKPGGMIAGHDYVADPMYPHIEVVAAVNEFMEAHPDCELEYLTREVKPSHPSFGIRRH